MHNGIRGFWMGLALSLVCAAGMSCLSHAVAEEGLNLVGKPLIAGDKAPSLAGVKWLTQAPADPTQPDGKKFYLLDVWATWCQPCAVTIPHLNRLQAKYADKGLVVMAVSQEEASVVEPFLQKTEMKYAVGVDAGKQAVPVYMNGIEGIPHAFLFDRTGTLVWHGHPLDNLEHVIRQVAAGRMDAAKAMQIEAHKTELGSIREPGKALEVFNKMIAIDPQESQYYAIKINILTQMRKTEEIGAVLEAWSAGCAESSDGLVELAINAVRQQDVEQRNPGLALQSVEKALTLQPDTPALILGAQVLCELGNPQRARAILGDPSKVEDEAQRKVLTSHAAYYDKLLKLEKK